jgi:predicted nucleotidyltransferase
MAKEILEQLFDSPVKVKLLKLFLRNPEESFGLSETVKKTRADKISCRRQISKLEEIKFIKSKFKSGKKIYSLNSGFVFYNELKTLVLKSSPTSKNKILSRLKNVGRIKLALLSGVFLELENSRADLLIVGDGIKNKKLAGFLKDLESEVGKEINYVVLTTADFKYRYNMFDRFIRDILEKPHEKLINRLKL